MESEDFITFGFKTLGSILFPFFCGGLSFIFLIISIILLGKILIDRKNQFVHIAGMVVLLFLIYPIIIFLLSIDFTEPLCFEIGFSYATEFAGIIDYDIEESVTQIIFINYPIPSYLDFFSLICLLSFILITIFNSRNIYFDDNTWLFFMSLSSALFNSILRLILFLNTCEGAPVSLIVVIIFTFISIIIFVVSEKLSQKRLK